MPINPNIALGVQQPQPVNMLGQMGQVMAIRQAQQQYEEQNALRDAFAQGADVNDPESFKRIASINPKLAMDLRSKSIEQRQKQTEIGLKVHDALGAALGGLVENPTLDYAKATFSHLVSTGVLPPDKAEAMFAKLQADPSRIKEYATLGVNAAISAKEKMADATSRRNTDVSAGPGYMQANLARERFNDERLRGRTIAGENQFLREDIYGNLSPVGSYGTQFGPNAAPAAAPAGGGGAPALPPAAANAFVTARPSVNAFAPTAPVSQPGAPTVANAAAIEAQQNIPRPPARAGYKYDQATGNLVKVPDEKAVWNDKAQLWMTPPTAENPQGKVVEAPAVQKAVQERTANATLKVAGYDPKTQTDEVSRLIKQSTSGLGENWANKVWSAISGTGSKGAEAIGQLETRANEMTLALAPNGSLGAGFSNEDRTFMLGKLGDVANPNKPMNVRLAAWEDVMERTARNAGVPYTKQSLGSSTKSSPKVIQFGELPK